MRSLRERRRKAERGIALVMVLGTLALLSVMLTEFQDTTSAELGASVAARDQVKAEYAARSAVQLTRLLVAVEPTIRQGLKASPLGLLLGNVPQIPVWDYSDAFLGAFSDEEGGMAFSNLSGLNLAEGKNLGMEGAGFRISVVDEDSKLNLNTAARADAFSRVRMAEQILALIGSVQYNPFFEELDEEDNIRDRATVCGALIDWVDPNTDLDACDPQNTNAIQSGAEDSYYQLLRKPYQRKNAAFDSIEEVRLVRGIGDDFWNTFIQPDPDKPESRVATVWGSGPVNVNTANPVTLLAMACHMAKPDTPLCIDPLEQARFLQLLKMVKAFSPGIPLFGTPKTFIETMKGKGTYGPMLFPPPSRGVEFRSEAQAEKALASKSAVFSVYATGYVRSGKIETKTRIHAVLDLRGAPPPGQAPALNAALAAAAAGAAPSAEALQEVDLSVPRPGGTYLYYRID